MSEDKKIGVCGSGRPELVIGLVEKGFEVLEDANALMDNNILYFANPEEQAKARRKELVEKYGEPKKSFEDQVLEELMPESNKLDDFVFGPPHRQEGETQEYYKARLKIEKNILRLRNNEGVTAWKTSEKGQLINKTKQKAKRYRKLKSKTRLRLSRKQRKEMGLL